MRLMLPALFVGSLGVGALTAGELERRTLRQQEGRAPTQVDSTIGYKMPDITVYGPTGSQHSLVSHFAAEERAAAFIFFNISCGGSAAEAMIWEALQAANADHMQVVAIAYADRYEALTEFEAASILTTIPLMAVTLEGATAAGVQGFPQAFVVDRNGLVVFKTLGMFATDDLRLWLLKDEAQSVLREGWAGQSDETGGEGD